MLELEQARDQILAAIPPPAAESVDLDQALGRFTSQDISALLDLPGFDNSSMDGFAVRSEDVRGAAAACPVRLRMRGRVVAGAVFDGELAPGDCVRVFTGSPLPRGADAVVMQEETQTGQTDSHHIEILDAVKPFENVRLQGEDVKRGQPLLPAGERLTAARLGLLAATGCREIHAARRPRLGLLATGSELCEAGMTLAPGKIFESNRIALSALANEAGAVARPFPLVADAPEATRAAMEAAFADSDLVVTSGGVSVGEMDFVKPAFEQLGGRLEFWKVAMRPGRPFVFGRLGQKLLFGLPGNPVSAWVTFLLLVRPALLRWQGARQLELPLRHGVLAETIVNSGGRRHFARVRFDAQGKVHSAGLQASHALSSLAAAQGLVEVSPQTTLAAGAVVFVLCWA